MVAVIILLGILPSAIWLAYWLRQDCHPEPKVLLTKTFLLGIILSPLAIVAQLMFVQVVAQIMGWPTPSSALGVSPADAFANSPTFYLWAAFVEEMVKWLAVYFVVIRNPEFDEPVDAMIYMLTAAMGFAAMENILVVNRILASGVLPTASVLGLRFAGATLLHALSSALLGYFIALAWFYTGYRKQLFILGLCFATVFHWMFNIFVSQIQQVFSLVFSTALLIAMAFLISTLFDKIKERDGMVRSNVC